MLDAPGGVIAVTAKCRNGKAERISIENVPSFAAGWTRRSKFKA